MRELLLALDVVVLEADGVGDAVDVRVVAVEEVQPCVRLGAAVDFDDVVSLRRRALERLARIEAERDRGVLLADGPRDELQRLDGLAEDEAADRRARVVRERQDDRALAVEEVAEA